MGLTTFLFLSAVFLFSVSLIQMCYLAWEASRFTERRDLKRRLLVISASGRYHDERLSLYKKEALNKATPLQRLLFSLPRFQKLDRMLLKSGAPLNASSFMLLTIALAVTGVIVGMRLSPGTVAPYFLGGMLACLPYLWIAGAERRALAKFEEQLPETLDLLGRSLRSGHALLVGFEIVVQEQQDPMKTEFAAAVTEINLGLSLREALENMCARVASRDLRFFVIAVTLQKETGGNLAEILDNISRLIRERMVFRRQVQSLTAEGRLSAKILIGLPIMMFVYLYFTNYDYISLLWTTKLGQVMMAVAVVAAFIGSLVMKKIVTIKA